MRKVARGTTARGHRGAAGVDATPPRSHPSLPREYGRKGDAHKALTLLRGLIGDETEVTRIWFFQHPGPPVSKARARWSPRSKGWYTPPKTVDAESALAWRFKEAMRSETLTRPIAIIAGFYRPNYQRIDIDNMKKLVLDAATKAGVWKDDCYVVAQASFVELDVEKPRTLVAWCEVNSTMDRAGRYECKVCGTKFFRAGLPTFKAPPQTCSRKCRLILYERDRATIRCAKCETVVRRRTAAQRYCSRRCATSDPIRRAKIAEQRPWPKCQTCGERVSRREYLHCFRCRRKGRPKGSKNRKPGVSARVEPIEEINW